MTTAPNTLYDDNAPALAALYTHVEEADLKAVRAALEAHPQWLVVPLFGLASQGTLLHLAARHGYLEIVDYLVKKGLDTGVLDGSHGTPLVDAAGAGHLATVRWLLDNGAAVDGDCRGILTPLIAAAVGGHSEVAELLVQHGADLDRLHLRFNQTALDTALVWGHGALAEWLAEQGGHCAQEQMDYTRVRGSGIFEHIFERVGFVLTPCPSQRLFGQDIDLRTALVGNGRAHKLLFTLGVHLSQPRIELMVALPYDWPLNQAAITSDLPCAFPAQLLWRAAQARLEGGAIHEGWLAERGDERFHDLPWPDGVDAMVAVDYRFPPATEGSTEGEVTLLLLVPMGYPRAGRPTPEKLADWAGKKRTASWKAVAIKA